MYTIVDETRLNQCANSLDSLASKIAASRSGNYPVTWDGEAADMWRRQVHEAVMDTEYAVNLCRQAAASLRNYTKTHHYIIEELLAKEKAAAADGAGGGSW